MSSVSSQHERRQLEEDIERIKSALQSSEATDWQLQVHIESEDEDDEDVQSTISRDDQASVSAEGTVNGRPRSQDDSLFKVPAVPSPSGPSHPGSEVIQMSLALNRAYQEIVMENLDSIEDMLAQNREQQAEVQEALTKELSEKGSRSSGPGRKRSITYYGMPYFRDKYGHPPPLCEEARTMQANREVSAFLRGPKMWTSKDKVKLFTAVEGSILKQRLQPLIIKQELELEKLEKAKGEGQEEEINQRLQETQQKMVQIRNKISVADMTAEEELAIDWMKISIVDFDGQRSAVDCSRYWKYAHQPSINTSSWRHDEDAKLAVLVEEHGGRDWQTIADDLQTSRTAFQCIQRFQTKLNPCLQTGAWTAEEDEFLKEVVESVTTDGNTPWDQVAYYMEGRSNEQCQTRWRMVSDRKKTGKWTKAEDKALLEGYTRYGKLWTKVREMVPGRSAQQCRERFMNSLTNKTKCGTWTYAEDKLLWQLVSEYEQGRWAAIAANIEGRTDNACLQRYRVLQRFHVTEEVILTLPKGREILQKLLRTDMREFKRPVSKSVRKRKLAKLTKTLTAVCKQKEAYQKQLDLRMLDPRRDSRKIEDMKKKLNVITIQEQQLLRQKAAARVKPVSDSENGRISEVSHEEEVQEVLEDRKKGIIIPRCLLGIRGVRSKLFQEENHEKLKKAISSKLNNVRKKLEKDHRDSDFDLGQDQVQRPVRRRKRRLGRPRRSTTIKMEEEDTPEESEPELDDQSPEQSPEPEQAPDQPPERPLEQPPEWLPEWLSDRPSFTRGRRANKNKQMLDKVNSEICSLLVNSSETRNKGRPKKYYAEPPEDSDVPKIPKTAEVESKVIKLLAKALNIDLAGATSQGRKVTQELLTESPAKKLRLTEDLERFKSCFGCELGSPSVATKTSSKANPNISLQMLPRSALKGEAGTRAYNLPPIPPTVSTLRGFKGLLLGRQNLIQQLKRRRPPPAKPKASEPAEGATTRGPEPAEGTTQDPEPAEGVTTQDPDGSVTQPLQAWPVPPPAPPADKPNLPSAAVSVASSPAVTVPGTLSRSSSLNTPPLPQSPVIRHLVTPPSLTSTPAKPLQCLPQNASGVSNLKVEEAFSVPPTVLTSNLRTFIPSPGVSGPGPGLSGPGPGVSGPGPSVSIPSPGVSGPSPSVSIPDPGVSVPGPGVSVPGPGVSVPGPGVSVPGPAVTKPVMSDPHKPSSQPKILVLKGSDLTPEALTQILKSKGIITDPTKIKMQLLNKGDLAKKVISNTGKVTQTMSSLKAKQSNRKRALSLLHQTHDYQLLRARFRALFLWPALMSTIQTDGDLKDQGGGDSEGDSDTEELTGIQEHWEKRSLILAASCNNTKKSKKSKTTRNRYPCAKGKRARQLNSMKREEKIQRFQNRRVKKEIDEDDSEDGAGSEFTASEATLFKDEDETENKVMATDGESNDEPEMSTVSYMVIKREEVNSDELDEMDSQTYSEEQSEEFLDLPRH